MDNVLITFGSPLSFKFMDYFCCPVRVFCFLKKHLAYTTSMQEIIFGFIYCGFFYDLFLKIISFLGYMIYVLKQ